MLIKWKDGHQITLGFGYTVTGLNHNGVRPNIIIIEPQEMLVWNKSIEELIKYIYKDLYACVKTFNTNGVIKFNTNKEKL